MTYSPKYLDRTFSVQSVRGPLIGSAARAHGLVRCSNLPIRRPIREADRAMSNPSFLRKASARICGQHMIKKGLGPRWDDYLETSLAVH